MGLVRQSLERQWPGTCVFLALGQYRLRINSFGDNVMSVTNIPGDLFRIRHDMVKTVLNSFCLTSHMRAECEVYGPFRDLSPVEALVEGARNPQELHLIENILELS
jgi:hypothetical protein